MRGREDLLAECEVGGAGEPEHPNTINHKTVVIIMVNKNMQNAE